MREIIDIIREFYQNGCSVAYEKGVCLVYQENTIKRLPLMQVIKRRGRVDINITRIDQMSERLAYVQVEYWHGQQYCTDIIGIIQVHHTWNVICVLTAYAPQRFLTIGAEQAETLHTISQILMRYCHDVHIMDAEDALSLFELNTRMYHPDDDMDTFTDIEIQVLRKRWANMPDPKELGILEFSKIYHVEMLDKNIAVAKVGCKKLNTYFNDYLFLMNLHGTWKIVNKLTHNLCIEA